MVNLEGYTYMSRRTKKKIEEKEGNMEVEIVPKPKKPIDRVFSFDAFFSLLKAKGKVMAHHKAPMKQYAKANGLEEGTQEEFERLFKRY